MTLGQRIQELRKQNNLSQEALGEKLGVSRQAISRWEMDGAVPEVDKLIALSKLFSVSLNDLLQVESGDGDEEKTPVVLAPSRRWKIGMAAIAVLLCISLVFSGFVGWKVTALEAKLSETAQQLADFKQSQSTNQTAPLVALMEHSSNWQEDPIGFSQFEKNWMMYCGMTLTLGRMTEGQTVILQLVDKAGLVELVEMENQGGAVWSAVFSVDGRRDPVTCTALVQSGEKTESQPLIRWSNMGEDDYRYTEKILWSLGG